MKSSEEKWVVKFETDQVRGPYTTDAICKMIATGAFSGNELICAYPEGEWKSLNKQPEFYEALLESLENPVEVDSKKAQRMDAETVVRSREELDTNSISDKERSLEKFKKIDQVVIHSAQKSDAGVVDQDAPQDGDIAMNNFKEIQRRELKKLLPFLVGCLLVVFVAGYYFLDLDEQEKTGWVLIAPKQNSSGDPDENIKDLKRKAVLQFQQGQLEGVLIAQRSLVRAVEAAPKDLEAMGLLCMAYHQLWPYTKQTIQDLKSILIVTQMVRSTNPISSYSEACQAVYLTAKGQIKEARSLVEKTLDNIVDNRFSLGPFLYLIKAELLEYDQNYINSAAYYDQTSQLWPQWIWPRIGLARMSLKQNKFSEARTQFSQIFKLDKESKAALYGLGIVEYKGFHNADKANQYFSIGYSLKQTLPKSFHVEALWSYAQLLVDRHDRSKALEVAQQGFQLNPSHRGLKELVITLGGSDQVENAHSEIILLGDQFARTSDHLAAVAQYKAAFELDPKNATAAIKAAKSLWVLNQSREAINWLNKAIAADPKQLSAYVLKADYESQLYNFVEAAKTLLSASRKSPQNYEILKGQALLEFRKNNMLGAIQYGERALKGYDADVELLTLLAQAHIAIYLNAPGTKKEENDSKNRQEAQRFSGKAIDLEPSWPESQITYAKYLSAVDGPLRGATYLKNLIKSFHYTAEYRIALAELYTQEEKYSSAADEYLQIVELEPKNKKANFGLAESYRLMNKPDLAQRYYNATSALDPSDVEPLFSNAKLLFETASGREAKAKIIQALAKFNVVKEINPNFPRVSYYLAKCYLELGDFQKAIQLVKEEKTKNPNLADPFLLAAEIFYRKEQFAECAAEYSMAIKLRPQGADLYVKSSICYRKSEAIDIAEDMLIIAEQKESGFPDIYREQGYIYEKKGYIREANAAFERYLELSPNAPDRSIIEQHLRK